MLRNYLKIAWRNLTLNKGYAFINIGGLGLGIAVAILIGLWAHDELSYNKHQDNYNSVAIVLQNNTFDGNVDTGSSQSFQLGDELRSNYGSNFKYVVMSSFPINSVLSDKEKALTANGCFMEAEAPELLTLNMQYGSRTGLQNPTSILLSASFANNFFGSSDPIGKVLKIDNSVDLQVTGVYEDIPVNSSFNNELFFIAPLDVLVKQGGRNLGWINNWLQVYVQLAENVDMQKASETIKNAKIKNVEKNQADFKPELFLHPMSKWHLNSGFKNGVITGGRIEYVRLFCAIGAFVLLLACINFINLSTARSQKRAKEVGVRKAIGSARSQLIGQFFVESMLVVVMAFIFSILLVHLALPSFNEIAGKDISLPWINPLFWLVMILFVFFISIISGSYPAFYLSSSRPAKVLKGAFRPGKFSSIPRKVLVVVQFTVSVALIIGSIIIYQQIQFAKNKPIGYEVNELITIPIKTQEVKNNFDVLRNDLLASGIISEISTSETTITNLWWSDFGFQWKGKDSDLSNNIYRGSISYEFGRTIGWKIKEGRDFSREFPTDSSAIILNEATVKYMGFENPLGEIIRTPYGKNFTVIGVVQDMITQSLYQPIKPTIFILDPFNQANFINIKIDPQHSTSRILEELKRVFVMHNPNTPFEYTFADDEFAEKYSFEVRIGKLVGIFAVLAIFIACLGLFGLASFVSELRTKEIGLRKVLGASVLELWQMLSKDFIVLVFISSLIAIPVASHFMTQWLQNYEYRIQISWWVFIFAIVGAMLITILTVSFQAIKAASANPVESLKSE